MKSVYFNRLINRGRLFVFALVLMGIALNSCVKKAIFIKVDSVSLGKIEDSILNADINFKVFNPNSIKSTITSSHISTFYKKILVGNTTINQEVPLPSNDTVLVPMASQINLLSLSKVFPELLNRDTVSFDIEGVNKVKSWGITFSVNLKDKIKLNVKQVINDQVNKTFGSDSNFKIRGLRLTNLPRLSKTGLQMTIQIKNSFPFDYQLTRLDLDIYKKNGSTAIANWRLADTIKFKSGATSAIPLKVEIDNLSLLSQVRLSDFLSPKMNFTVKGTAEVSISGHPFSIPIEETSKISFNNISGFNL